LGGGRRREHRSLEHPAPLAGTPILEQQFPGDQLRLALEIAWGAQPGTDPATWLWTDVTSDVQVADGKRVSITVGRADEASATQPASCTAVLDNRLARYSKSPLSPNYPHVTRNVPVRVRAIYLGGSYTRFFGYATGFPPSWDVTGNYAVVTLKANGALRRLGQGTATLRSPLERAVSASTPVAYWPMEDTQNSSSLASAVAGVAPMSATGLSLASNSGLLGSDPLPMFGNGGTSTIVGEVPAWTPTQYWEVHWYNQLTQPAVDTTVMFISTTGTYKTWEVAAAGTTDGLGQSLILNVYDALGNKTTISRPGLGNFYTNWAYVKLFVSESGGVVTWTFEVFPASGGGGGFVSNTLAATAGVVTSISSPPAAGLNGMALGHVAVWNEPISTISNIDSAGGGYNNQDPVTRITRLCREQGEQITVNGSSNSAMGVQSADTYMNLLRACEKVDQGLLYDGLNAGLTYTSRDLRENATAILTLSAGQQDLTPPWTPADDDQYTVNQYVASRQGGSSYTATDTTDTLGTLNVGTYSSSDTFNTFSDADLQQYAWWEDHLGTVDGYRYPQVAFSLHRRPQYVPAWLQTMLLTPIVVANPATALTQMPPEDISLVLQGYTETFDKFTWDVVANTTPFDPWRIAVIAQETGDTSPYAWRLESDGSTLVTGVAAGATSLTVATPSGPLWTTVADDFPLVLSVGGIEVTATAIAGASSPQTFTVNPVPYKLPTNAAVTLWKQPVLGL
jgi:hypothetical protein